MPDINDTWAQHLTDERLASDLDRLASYINYLTGPQRAAILREAARRLTSKGDNE